MGSPEQQLTPSDKHKSDNSDLPLQFDMFTGELVDPRTAKEKRRDVEREKPRQMEMFPQRQLAQFGVKARPQLPLSNRTHLELSVVDPRTDEEKEYDRQKAAEAQTYSFLEKQSPFDAPVTKLFPSGLRLVLLEDDEEGLSVALNDDLALIFWTTRDEEYDRARETYHRDGYRVFEVGDSQLEIWAVDESGNWLVTYSDMDMIENVVWTANLNRGY